MLAEVRDHLDVDLQSGAALHVRIASYTHDLLIDREDAEGQVDVLGDTVLHQLELAIRRNEGDGTVLVELAQTHTAVEGAIIDLDARALTAAVALSLLLVGDEQLIIQTETTLGHARQERLHHNLTDHFAAKHSAGLRDEQIHTLQSVDEHLVLTVRDTFTTPAYHTWMKRLPIDGTGDLRRDGAGVFLDVFRSSTQTDEHLHQINCAVLGVAVVQHFYTSHADTNTTIEDFVHDGETLTQVILIQNGKE